jgi:hypothetical protein
LKNNPDDTVVETKTLRDKDIAISPLGILGAFSFAVKGSVSRSLLRQSGLNLRKASFLVKRYHAMLAEIIWLNDTYQWLTAAASPAAITRAYRIVRP